MNRHEKRNSQEKRVRCEALVQGSALVRLNHDLQCSRLAVKRPDFAGVALCYQHMEKAEWDEELELIDGRTLILARESYDEVTEIETLVFQVVSNVSHFHRVQRAPVTRKELATQLVLRHFGSPMPRLVESFSNNDALMELAAQDMSAAQGAISQTFLRSMGMNVVEFPDRSEEETNPRD